MSNERYEIVSYESLGELCSVMRIDKANVLGDVSDNNNMFQVIKLPNNNSVGITYYNHGIKPQIFIETKGARVFICFDKIFIGFDCSLKNKFLQKELASLFHEFIVIESLGVIIIICELDVYVIKNNGEQVWSIGFKDIVVDFHIINENLFIKCDDGDKTTFSIKDGSIIS